MTDEAAESRGPATTGEPAPSPGAPAPSPAPPPASPAPAAQASPPPTAPVSPAPTASVSPAPTAPVSPPPTAQPSPPPTAQASTAPVSPAPAAGAPSGADPAAPAPGPDVAGGPAPATDAPADGPAAGGTRFSARYRVARPQQGRYVAGVCAAIGRATNTDPVLWRVILAVLGFFGGIGILVYLAAWLIIPAEGDTASPIEALLGRGRSSMSPVTVLLLGVLVAVMFGFIVTDMFRAALLGAAILVGGALLVNRGGAAMRGGPLTAGAGPAHPGGPPGPFPPAGATYGGPAGDDPTLGFAPTSAPPTMAFATAAPPVGYPSGPGTTGYPTGPGTAGFPGAGQRSDDAPTGTLPSAADPVTGYPPPPSGGYRAPFAPHGPYATTSPYPPAYPAPAPPAVRPPKPKRPRSRLGKATFSLVLVAIGLVAMLDLTGDVPVWPSTYFAAALVTIAAGLLVGAWFGRSRWLITLGLLASLGLGISTAAESWNGVRATGDVTWSPADVAAVADRYDTSVGDATLDLSRIDFTGQDMQVTVQMQAGTVEVILPPDVDVSTRVDMKVGDAEVLGQSWGGAGEIAKEISDAGAPGGGKLRLLVTLNAGHVEVHR